MLLTFETPFCLAVVVGSGAARVEDKIGNFNPYDTVNRFPPAASAQVSRVFYVSFITEAAYFDVIVYNIIIHILHACIHTHIT